MSVLGKNVTRLTRRSPLPRVGPTRDVSSITRPRHHRNVPAPGPGTPRIAIVSNYRAPSSSGRSLCMRRTRARRPTCRSDAGAAGYATAARTTGPALRRIHSTARFVAGAGARTGSRRPPHDGSRPTPARRGTDTTAPPTTSKFFVRTHDFSTLTVLTSYAADHAVSMARARHGDVAWPGWAFDGCSQSLMRTRATDRN
jgi:hypothetical protein